MKNKDLNLSCRKQTDVGKKNVALCCCFVGFWNSLNASNKSQTALRKSPSTTTAVSTATLRGDCNQNFVHCKGVCIIHSKTYTQNLMKGTRADPRQETVGCRQWSSCHGREKILILCRSCSWWSTLRTPSGSAITSIKSVWSKKRVHVFTLSH